MNYDIIPSSYTIQNLGDLHNPEKLRQMGRQYAATAGTKEANT